MNNKDKNEQDTILARRETYEQVASILALNGVKVDLQAMAYMEPLLNGTQTYEEHRAMLQSLMAEFPA